MPAFSLTYRPCRPIKGIKEIGSLFNPVWGMPAGVVGGKEWSLDDVENYLRKPPSPLKYATVIGVNPLPTLRKVIGVNPLLTIRKSNWS